MLKKLLYGAAVALGTTAVSLLLWWTGWLDGVEYAAWGWRVRGLAKPGADTAKIKLILLDQASLDWGKKENGLSWPWPREMYSAVIGFCLRGGARVIAFDVLFTEPSVYGVADDRTLGAAMRRAPPFIGAVFLGGATGDAEAWPAGARRGALPIEGLRPWVNDPARKGLVLPRAAFPIADVVTNAAVLANVSEDPDPDGVIRRVRLFRMFDGEAVPSLGFAAFLMQRAAGPGAALRMEGNALAVGGGRVPLDRQGRTILKFRGPVSRYETLSVAAVIQSELRIQANEKPPVDPACLKDAVVFLGFSAPGLLDLRPTPVSSVSPGVFVHATLVDNLMAMDTMRDVSAGAMAAGALALALAGALLVVFTRKAWQSVAVFVLLLPVPIAVGFAGYSAGYWWPVVPPWLSALLSLIGGVVINYATEGRQKAFIKQAFRHYLSPAVIERILEDPSQLRLGGERRELTIFFSDLQGFSSLSEKLDPPQLTSLLNDYLTDMTDIILEEGGTLDKYEGDAIIAFWNAPLRQDDHIVRACRAAIRCQRKLAARRPEFLERSGVALHMRIGINTGDVVVGNMGSRERFDYTVLGDAANLASRLEGANKAFGTYTMVSESTWKGTGGQIVGRELGRLRVVGRKTPVTVYELLGFAGEPGSRDVEEFGRALALGYGGDWKAARAILEKLEQDPPSKIYAAKCRELADDSAGVWDGIWNLTQK